MEKTDFVVMKLAIEKLELEDGDVLAVQLNNKIDDRTIIHIEELLQNILPKNVRTLVYHKDDVELRIIHQQTACDDGDCPDHYGDMEAWCDKCKRRYQ